MRGFKHFGVNVDPLVAPHNGTIGSSRSLPTSDDAYTIFRPVPDSVWHRTSISLLWLQPLLMACMTIDRHV